MIRREAQSADGSPQWILIPQIDHAHLAGMLAAAWEFEPFTAEFRQELRSAVWHHDDGWQTWDASPGVDPAAGRPIAFDEMRLSDSLAIWKSSISSATRLGPMCGYFVAGHFMRLLERFDSWRTSELTRPLAMAFLEQQRQHSDELLAAWQREDPSQNSSELAERGVSYVQLFDAISLWLCCAERRAPWQVKLPERGRWTLAPLARNRLGIDPWPLCLPRLEVAAAGRVVPPAHYTTTENLLA